MGILGTISVQLITDVFGGNVGIIGLKKTKTIHTNYIQIVKCHEIAKSNETN